METIHVIYTNKLIPSTSFEGNMLITEVLKLVAVRAMVDYLLSKQMPLNCIITMGVEQWIMDYTK